MVTPSVVLTSDFVPFVGDPRQCRGDVAFPPSFVVCSTIVMNVLTPALVRPILFVKYTTNDSWSR